MATVNLAVTYADRGGYRANEDDAIFTTHWRADADNWPDAGSIMDDDARQEAKQRIETFLANIAPLISTRIKWREVRFYEPDANGKFTAVDFDGPLGMLPGGSGAQVLPPQIACSITFKTAKRKNWGRFYVPGLTVTSLDPDGSIQSGTRDSFASNAALMTERGSGGRTTLTVWSPTENTHHDPQIVQVDDVPDVIRSRRFKQPLYRNQVPAG